MKAQQKKRLPLPAPAVHELVAVDGIADRDPEIDNEARDRLETLTLMSRGMVHDLNGLLTAVVLLTDAMQRDPLSTAESQASDLGTIKDCAHQARDLLDQFVLFVKSEQTAPEYVELEVLLEELQLVLKALVGNRAKIKTRHGPGFPRVFADRTALRRVVVNLVQNAAEAFTGFGGQITIASGIDNNGYAFIEIADDGPGMDAPTQARMFDPYFTTKRSGTGLGLMIVRRIIDDHRGTIEVYSSPGRGTLVRVCIPHVPAPEAHS